MDVREVKSANPPHRPTAPRLNLHQPSGFINALLRLRETKGMQFSHWPAVVERGRATWLRELIEGAAAATFDNLQAVARLVAVVDVPTCWATDHPLPPIDREITIADLRRLRRLAPNVYVKKWAEQRLEQILTPQSNEQTTPKTSEEITDIVDVEEGVAQPVMPQLAAVRERS